MFILKTFSGPDSARPSFSRIFNSHREPLEEIFPAVRALFQVYPESFLLTIIPNPEKKLLKQAERVCTRLERELDELASQPMGLENRGDEGNGAHAFLQSAFRFSIPFHRINQITDGGEVVVHRSFDVVRFRLSQSARG